MKSFYITLFAAISLTSTLASAKDLNDSELVYSSLARAFPHSVEHAGGLSSSIEFQDLSCAASNSRQKGRPVVVVSCMGTQPDGQVLTYKGKGAGLVVALINAGMNVDTKSEPGTTYVSASDLECVRMECKSSNPYECVNVPVTYSCSAN